MYDLEMIEQIDEIANLIFDQINVLRSHPQQKLSKLLFDQFQRLNRLLKLVNKRC
jgi:hypothetical protein